MTVPAVENNQRKIIDVIMRSCTVALFHTNDVAVAPTMLNEAPVSERGAGRMVGIIRFTGKGFTGSLELSIPEEILTRIAGGQIGPYAARDLVRELTNQLMGRVKNRLVQFQVQLSIGVPTGLLTPPAPRAPVAGRTRLTYGFRTRSGMILVSLEGVFDETALVFSPAHLVAQEGDMILF